jgi:glycerol-3-phosphate dehydrogenase
MLTISGGKLTTWRVMAEEVVDEALNYLPEERAAAAAPCYTAGTPFVGLAPLDLEDRLRAQHDITAEVAAGLARRLRGAAWAAPRLARGLRELQPLIDGNDLTAAEARVHLRQGAVLRLEDLLLRRARIGLWQPALARELAPRLRPLFEDELGWEGQRWEAEEEALRAALEAWSVEGVQ